MSDKPTYPPITLKGGEVSELVATDGTVEFHCQHNPDVVDFLIAYDDLRMLDIMPIQPSNATREYAARKVEKMWHRLPASIFHAMEERRG